MKKKRKKKLILFVLLLCFSVVLIKQQITINKLKNEGEHLSDKLVKEKEKTDVLQGEIELSKRPDYLERIAREKLRLIKPGEILIIDRNKQK